MEMKIDLERNSIMRAIEILMDYVESKPFLYNKKAIYSALVIALEETEKKEATL